MIVVDASVVLDILLRSADASLLEDRVLDPTEVVNAPHLIDVESAHVLRRYAALGELSNERGREALADLADLPIERFGHTLLLPKIWQLRNNVTAYDAAYIALAEALSCPLLTRDERLANAPCHNVSVELI